MARTPIGPRIRERRRERRMTQTALAEAVGISPSYLNLIEHDKRQIGGALVRRIARALELDVGALSGIEDARLAQDVLEIGRSLGHRELDERSASDFVARTPGWARALVTLHRAYRDAVETTGALSDRLSQDPALMELGHAVLNRVTAIRSFAEILEQHGDLAPQEQRRFSHIVAAESDQLATSAREMLTLLGGSTDDEARPTSPEEEVDDFIIRNGNHFPALEEAADALRAEAEAASGGLSAALEAYGTAGAGRTDGADDAAIDLPETTLRFRRARGLAEARAGDLLDAAVDDPRLASEEARTRAHGALASYVAGALLFPYDLFLETAEALRYDVDRLALRFGGSFEQAAHRLVTLRRPGAEGVPFAFLRSDPAGNLSKPFSTPGLRMPRFGGSCPRWALHAAFGEPDRPIAQLAVMPGGERHLFVARRVSKRTRGFGTTPVVFAVMLGCDAVYADRLVYGDAFAGRRDGLATPVGVNCRTCRRTDCAQRAHPPVLTPAAGAGAEA